MCVGVLPVCMYMYVCPVPVEARREFHIPWDWSSYHCKYHMDTGTGALTLQKSHLSGPCFHFHDILAARTYGVQYMIIHVEDP